MTLKLKATEFEYTIHNETEIESNLFDDYTFYGITAWNKTIINKQEFNAVYQTGDIYYHSSYDLPSNEFSLSKEAGTDDLLCKIDSIYEEDFEKKDYIKDILCDVKKMCPGIDTVKKLREVYDFLNKNLPVLDDFI